MADAKDRRTNMTNSSVHAQPAKDGAGGQYTWGKATDVIDYVPTGVDTRGMGVQLAGVPTTAPVVMQAMPYQAQAADFPSIGNPSQAAPVYWGRPVSQASSVAMAPTVSAAPPTAPPAVSSVAMAPAVASGPPPMVVYLPMPAELQSALLARPQEAQSTQVLQAGSGWARGLPVACAQQPVPLPVMRAEVVRATNYAPTVHKSHAPMPARLQMPRK